MRTTLILAAVASVIALPSVASADAVSGSYDVKYEEVSNNCPSPLRYAHGRMEVKNTKGQAITVDIDRTPLMLGSRLKKNGISAKSKSGPTMLDGMDGVFSLAGKITPEGLIDLMMIGEYSVKGKALCSQSWKVVGTKDDGAASPPPAKKSAK